LPLRQTLGEGARVWGAVAEVGARELVVSLPHGLRGHVALTEVPPATPAGAWQLLRLGLHAGPPTVLQFCRCTLSALAPSRARSLEVRQAGSAASWSKHLCTHPIWLRPLLNPHERRQASDVLAELVVKAEAAAAAAAAAVAGPATAAGRAAAAAAAAVPALAELFSVGQLVRCTVIGKQGGSEGAPGHRRASGSCN